MNIAKVLVKQEERKNMVRWEREKETQLISVPYYSAPHYN
jgi:hypothetical protein